MSSIILRFPFNVLQFFLSRGFYDSGSRDRFLYNSDKEKNQKNHWNTGLDSMHYTWLNRNKTKSKVSLIVFLLRVKIETFPEDLCEDEGICDSRLLQQVEVTARPSDGQTASLSAKKEI